MIIHCYLENDFSRNKDSSTEEKRSRIVTDFHYSIILRTHKTSKGGEKKLKTQICIKGDEISFANGKGKKKWGDGWCVFARISNSPYLLNPGTTPYYLM